MADSDDVADAAAENASGPKRMRVGNNEVEQHSIEEQIALDKHLASKEQMRSPRRLIFNKISPPGSA